MSQYKEWQIQIFNKRTNTYLNDSTGKAYVMVAGEPTLVTLKADQQGTALAQPITMSGGRLSFFTAKSVTSVDVTFLTSTGFSNFAKGISSSVHRLDVYPEDRGQHLIVPIIDTGSTAIYDSGFSLVNGMVIHDAHVKISSVVATGTTGAVISVGLSADEDGLLSDVPIATVGYKQSVGANTDAVEFVYYGALLAQADISTTDTEPGIFIRLNHAMTQTEALVYEFDTAASNATAKGYIILDYSVLPPL